MPCLLVESRQVLSFCVYIAFFYSFVTHFAGGTLFDNTLNQSLSNANPGTSALMDKALMSSPSGLGVQVFFVLQPDVDAQVYLSLGVNASTPGSTSFVLHLYADDKTIVSSQLAEFNAIATTDTPSIVYVTFDLRGYTLTAGQTYLMLIAPSSGM